MNYVEFSLKRLLTVTQENKKDLTMLLTGIKMVSEMAACNISINTNTVKADVTRDYKTNFVTINTPNYGLMFDCNDSGALAYYALAVLGSDDPEVAMEDIIAEFSTKAMYFKKASENYAYSEKTRYLAELKLRMNGFVLVHQVTGY